MKINDDVFKAYDVRGAVGQELNGDLAYAIGRSLADFLPVEGAVAVGRDMRPESQELADRLSEGLTRQGRDVIDIGLVTSDMIYFAVGKFNLAGGAMVTASHNPGKYNGIKIYRDGVRAVGLGTGLEVIRDAVKDDRFASGLKAGSITQQNILEDWVDHCLSFITSELRPFRIAIDAGNGMAGAILPTIQAHLPLKVTELFYELDGTFPNHLANPQEVKNLQDLINEIKQNHLDFGIAFDGDGDRAVFVDDLGRPVGGGDLISIVAKHYLELYPGSEVVYDVRTGRATKELITEWGGRPFRTKAGRVSIGTVMREHDAPFGGETTGHLFFKENYFADSGLIGALVAMVALSESGQKSSDLVDKYRRYYSDPEMNFTVDDASAKLKQLSEKYSDAEQDTLDGLTVNYPEWWFNVRASNTEPLIRVNVEANSSALLQQKRKEISDIIKS